MVEVDDLLLLCAFRYALGRATYVVGAVADDLIRLALTMRDADRDLIVREITTAEQYGPIGMPMDHQRWMQVRDAMTAQKTAPESVGALTRGLDNHLIRRRKS